MPAKLIDISFIPQGKERDDFLRKLVATPKQDRQRLMELTIELYRHPAPVHLKEGEVFPFRCPCGKTVPYTDGTATCECGHILTSEERDIAWSPETIH